MVHTQQIFSNVKAINRYIFGHVVHIELKHSQVYTVGMLNFNRYALNADRIVISKSQWYTNQHILVLVVWALSNSTQLVSYNSRMQTEHPRERRKGVERGGKLEESRTVEQVPHSDTLAIIWLSTSTSRFLHQVTVLTAVARCLLVNVVLAPAPCWC